MDNLDKLFYWRGIADEYHNYRGERVAVSLENRRRLLQAMGVDTDSPEVVAKQAYALDIEPWRTWFPPLLMTDAGERSSFSINLMPDDLQKKFYYEIFLESGGARSGEFVPRGRRLPV
jgi:4-alpha-glucanotransferase